MQRERSHGSQYFDFSNRDLAKISDDAAFNFPHNSSFSILYWLKFSDTQYGLNGGQDHIVISKGDWNTGGPSTAMWASGVNGSGKVNFLLSDDTGYKIDLEGEGHYNDGQWHQVACVRDESNDENILYVDGIIVDRATHNYKGSFTNSDKICIAHLMNLGEPQYYYMGFVDEIAIYNRALNASEITNLIASASSGVGICNETATSLLENPSPASFILFPVPATDLMYVKLTDAFTLPEPKNNVKFRFQYNLVIKNFNQVTYAFAPCIFAVDQNQAASFNNKINFTTDWKIVYCNNLFC